MSGKTKRCDRKQWVSPSVHKLQPQHLSNCIAIMKPLEYPLTVFQKYTASNVCLCCYNTACQMDGACRACCQRAEACVYEDRCDICKRRGAEECDGDSRCNNCRASRIPAEYCGKSCSSCYSKRILCDGETPICDQCLEIVAKRCAEARGEAGAQG